MIQEIEVGFPESQSIRRDRRVVIVGNGNAGIEAALAAVESARLKESDVELILNQKQEAMNKKSVSLGMLALMASSLNYTNRLSDDIEYKMGSKPTWSEKRSAGRLRAGRTMPGPFYKARKKKNHTAGKSRAKNRR